MVKYFQDDPNPPPFIRALAEVRHLATREGWCYQHVQAIAIDQYAEKALCNREYFLNKPYSIGGGRKDHVRDSNEVGKNARRGPPSVAGIFVCELRCDQAYFHAGVHQTPASDIEVQGTQGRPVAS